MAGAMVTPATSSGLYANIDVNGIVRVGFPPSSLSPSELNAFRISAVIDRLNVHLNTPDRNNAAMEFLNLCLSLSRGIDFAIANHEVPNRSRELPSLIKHVCQNRNDPVLQAAIMVLMISVKSACQNGWFSDGDSEELTNLAKEISSNFCSVSDFNAEPSCSVSVISTVMSRFFPGLRMGHILVFLEVKPGYEAYVSDFQISKNLKSSPGDKIRLFVVQTDSIETSSCLVTPANVNFLLNGKGVERRTNIFMDPGPQSPTIVTPFLKYGSNLLQAVGEFNGNCIIAVAFMKEVPYPDSNTLEDYEQLAPATVDADSEVIEGPSRISLNCPISFTRIRTPVKGHLCKHIQCFDFDNYVDINSRRPSWRCPHCNQHVCFSDIRIDQKMAKILKEVGPNVSDIVISSDGSWDAVTESEDTVKKPEDKTSNIVQDESPLPADVLDLTQDDMIDAIPTHETRDIKHSSTPHESQTNNANQSNNQVDVDFWSGIFMSTFDPGSSNVGTSSPNTMPLQQQFSNPSMANEYGRSPSLMPSHITRIPSAVQALPAQSPASVLQRSSTNGLNSSTPTGLSVAPQASHAAVNLTTSHAQPQASHAALNLTTGHAQQRHVSSFSSSPFSQHSNLQHNSPLGSPRPPQQNAGFLDSNQVSNMYRVSNDHSSTQQMANMRVPRATSQPPGLIHSPMQSSRNFIHPQRQTGLAQARPTHGPGVASNQLSQIAATNRAAQMSIDSPRTVPINPWTSSTPPGINGATSRPAVRADTPDPADMSWRPAGRMRGALQGQAYQEQLNRVMGWSSQPAQAARPVSNMTSPPTVRPDMQSVMAGAGVAQGIPSPNYGNTVPHVRPTGSNVWPNGSSGMQ